MVLYFRYYKLHRKNQRFWYIWAKRVRKDNCWKYWMLWRTVNINLIPGRVWRRVWLIEGQLQKFNPQFKANNDSSKTVAKNYRHRPFFTFIPHINKNHVQWEKFLNVTIQKTTIILFHILSLNYLIFLCTEYFPKRFLATDLMSI